MEYVLDPTRISSNSSLTDSELFWLIGFLLKEIQKLQLALLWKSAGVAKSTVALIESTEGVCKQFCVLSDLTIFLCLESS